MCSDFSDIYAVLLENYKAIARYDSEAENWVVEYPWGTEVLVGEREAVFDVMVDQLDLRA